MRIRIKLMWIWNSSKGNIRPLFKNIRLCSKIFRPVFITFWLSSVADLSGRSDSFIVSFRVNLLNILLPVLVNISQGFGSGSALDPHFWSPWIRIRINVLKFILKIKNKETQHFFYLFINLKARTLTFCSKFSIFFFIFVKLFLKK